MLARIKAIETGYSTQGEKIAAVLNFVQEEVRYLGFESGLGSYKPFAPNQVFEQRYGDCKDKSLLMVTMLRKMGIEAYPVLVNTALKHNINAVLPHQQQPLITVSLRSSTVPETTCGTILP